MASRFRPEGVTLGITCLGLGGLALLANLGYLDLLKALRLFWPLVLVIWGLAELVNTYAARRTS
jgi:hypothetical protein